MTITTTLPGFPQINQLNAPTMDKQPDEDARLNCVPASIAAGLTYLTGTRYEPDELKDAVYGQNATGAQDARRFVQYCADRGVVLAPHQGSQWDLIGTIHHELAAGHPVVVTMPSQWAIAPSDPVHPSGWTHVGVMCGYGAGELRCMNPWGGFWQDESDAWWAARLCYGEVWPMRLAVEQEKEKAGTSTMPATNTAGLGDGMKAYVEQHSVTAECVSKGEHEYDPGETFASFANGLILYYSAKTGVKDDLGGYVAAALWNNLDGARKALSQATAASAAKDKQIKALTAQVADLQAQVAAAKSAAAAPVPASAPVPAPVPVPAPAPQATHPQPTAGSMLSVAEAIAALVAAIALEVKKL